jgi:3-hydroxyisobutyrate dehydrogenase-like beta-hydroxyacid dehydrogenase
MNQRKIGILNPGNMGIRVAAAIQNTGHGVYWASDGRGPQTCQRASEMSLKDARNLEALCATCSAIVSVCPPHAAEAVAEQVAALGFKGLYLDANAISPQRTRQISQVIQKAGADFVDGGIIGLPPIKRSETWLYLSGPRADEAASFFAGGPLETSVIGAEIGKASALKMCYAAYTKGTAALLGAILATASVFDVSEELHAQWSRDGSKFADESRENIRRVSKKAWRFIGEMKEISSTFQSAGLPGGFHDAAANIYARLAGFKDAPALPSIESILEALKHEIK